MAIADLQRRISEVGRIRLGKKTSTGRAARLETLRFTSSAQHLIEEIAALYGGDAVPWQNEKKKQFEVITDAEVIPIYLPPQTIDPWYESWANGVCLRRCDGVRNLIHEKPCDCDPDDRKCKPTTRVNVMLADVQGLGVWRLETHGIYAAGEMAQLSDTIQGIRIPLPARLVLEKRGGKKFDRTTGKIETLDYNVPVIHVDAVTSRTIHLGHDAISQAVRAGGHGTPEDAPQIEAAPATPALEAAPAARAEPPAARPQQWDPAVIQRALAAIEGSDPAGMADIHTRLVKMGSPDVLMDAFRARLGQFELEAQEARRVEAERRPPARAMDGGEEDGGGYADAWSDDQEQDGPPGAPAAPPEAPEPEIPTDTPPAQPQAPEASGEALATAEDRQAASTRLLTVASQKGIKRADLEAHMQQQHGVGLKAATVHQLTHLTDWIGG